MDTNTQKNINQWLTGNFDEATKAEIRRLQREDTTELEESFYTSLEFGTGGLRGIMGVGTNRMNVYTIGFATQGLANYLKKVFGENNLSVAIAHDCRNNSQLFAQTTANVFSANGIKAYLFDALRPTPELSFAVRHFGCKAGVVVTASHNPKEYNGYKAYWDDGAQLVPPHDKNVIGEVNAITNVDDVKFEPNPNLIETIGNEIDELYLAELKKLSLSPEIVAQQKNMPIVYTPIHGTGVELAPRSLRAFGFENIYNVPEQDVVDGNFPTVVSPNPENKEALQMALDRAKAVNAELVMATDPDSDRVGIAVRQENGEFALLNGNQTASILLYYLITVSREKGLLKGNEYIVKTIVTSDILFEMAEKSGIEYFEVLTGFKYIADIIRKNEGKKRFLGGGEESYGYLVGEFVRDKDAIMSVALIAEAIAWAKSNGKTALDLLNEIYLEFGLYKEALVNVVKKGMNGAAEIQEMMTQYRNNPPVTLGGEKVVSIKDFQSAEEKTVESNTVTKIDLPKSNVLQFITEKGGKVSVRPSGTEPKIKFYVSVKTKISSVDEIEAKQSVLDQQIEQIKRDLGL